MPGSLAARDISKSYAAVQVLDRISLVVSPGDRIGIVGPNGIGKSTLLRVLAGLEPADGGRIIRSGAVGFLPQEPERRAGETVLGYLGRVSEPQRTRSTRSPPASATSRSSPARTPTPSTASSPSAARTSRPAPARR